MMLMTNYGSNTVDDPMMFKITFMEEGGTRIVVFGSALDTDFIDLDDSLGKRLISTLPIDEYGMRYIDYGSLDDPDATRTIKYWITTLPEYDSIYIDLSSYDGSDGIDILSWGGYLGSFVGTDVAVYPSFYSFRVLSSVVPSWSNWGFMTQGFFANYYPIDITEVVKDWNTSHVTNMAGLFGGYYPTQTVDLSNWDVSNVTTLDAAFNDGNIEIANMVNWDVSSLQTMAYFAQMNYYFNDDVSNWDVSNVTNMAGAFAWAYSFSQPIGKWDVSNVENMDEMLSFSADGGPAPAFDEYLGGWCVTNIPVKPYDFGYMAIDDASNPRWGTCPAAEADIFVQPNGITLSAGNQAINNTFVTDGVSWYYVASSKTIYDIANLYANIIGDPDANVSITDRYAVTKSVPLKNVLTTRVMSLGGLFFGKSSFDQDISTWDLSYCVETSNMFRNASAFNQDINPWNTRYVWSMAYMFDGATAFDQDLSEWCVPDIVSKPTNFDTNSGFAGNSAKQPQWGTCPRGENA